MFLKRLKKELRREFGGSSKEAIELFMQDNKTGELAQAFFKLQCDKNNARYKREGQLASIGWHASVILLLFVLLSIPYFVALLVISAMVGCRLAFFVQSNKILSKEPLDKRSTVQTTLTNIRQPEYWRAIEEIYHKSPDLLPNEVYHAYETIASQELVPALAPEGSGIEPASSNTPALT